MPDGLVIFPVGGGGAPPPPGSDIYGPTRIVSNVVGEGTDTTIASALTALAATGGYIQLKPGTYSIAATQTMPLFSTVIRGSGEGASIVDIGANAIAAFTIPTGLAAERTYTFEDLQILGTAVANQRGWSVQDVNSRGVLKVNRVTTTEIQRPFEVAHAGTSFVSTLIFATDCFFQQVTGNTSTLVYNSPNFKQVQIAMDRVRFYRSTATNPTEIGTVVGQLTAAGLFSFSNINIIAVDSVFALGAADFNVAAFNLDGCSLVNNAPIANFRISIASDNEANVADAVANCNIQFQDFDLNGTGTKFSNCRFESCSFADNAESSFADCYFDGIGNVPSTAVITSAGSAVVIGCWFTGDAEGTISVLEDPYVVSGCYIEGGPVCSIDLYGGFSVITGNEIFGTVPVRENTSGNNRMANNWWSAFPTLVAGSSSIIDDRMVRTVSTTPVTLNRDDRTILSDATGGARVVNLPTAASAKNHVYTIKKIDASANTVTIDGSGAETIDGALTVVLTTQWQAVKIQSNGTAWFIV